MLKYMLKYILHLPLTSGVLRTFTLSVFSFKITSDDLSKQVTF